MNWIALLLLLWAAAVEIRPVEGNFVHLEVFKTGLMSGKKHVIDFPEYSGKADAAAGTLELTIPVAKLAILDDWVSEKDRAKIRAAALEDVLASAKFPVLQYRGTSLVKTGASYAVKGNLTIRGRSQPVELAIRGEGGDLYSGSAEIDLRQFGIKPPSALLGAIGTNPVMRLSFKLRVAGL